MNKYRLFRVQFFLLIIVLLAFSDIIKAVSEKGRIMDSIVCGDHPEYNYALYLPEKYSDSVSWPVIFIFDPGARGRFAITHFTTSAELYGYILVSSNNSRNGLEESELEKIINCLMTDVQNNYSIDRKRIYTSGFSGGSRVASLIAINNKNIAGVIACGAGFPSLTNLNNLPAFDYYGLIGDCDVNYLEMKSLKSRLDAVDFKMELRVFEGSHSWPSSNFIQEAVEWMEFMAILKKMKQMDSAFVRMVFLKTEMQAKDWLKHDRIIESVECYKSLCKWFPEYVNTDFIRNFSDSLQQSKEYTKELRKEYDAFLIEIEFQEKMFTELKKTELLDEISDSTRLWWIKQIESIKKTASEKNSLKQRMAKRQLNFLTVHSNEIARELTKYNFYKAAAIFYQIIAWIQPENGDIFYILARTYALDKNINKSMVFLKLAVKKGFNNFNAIKKDSAFDTFRNEKKFINLLAKFKN